MQLTLDSTPLSLAASLVALVAGYTSETLTVASGSALTFEGAAGKDVLSLLATKKDKSSLIGDVALLSSLDGSIDIALLERLNTQLGTSSFLVPNSFQPTLFDYATWAYVRELITSIDQVKFQNLLRWSRYIVASIPRNASTSAWVKVPLTSVELPLALQSKIYEMDLAACAAADSKLRQAAPVAAAVAAGAKSTTVAAPKEAKAAAAPAAAAASSSSAPAAAAPAKEKKEKKEKAPAAPKAAVAEVPQVYRVDFRVGRILSVENHPTEARLFVEQIDVGEEKPRTVVSGLAEHFKAEDLVQKLVVVMVNLKAGDLKGVVSNGRVMVATGADGKKELATPPEGAKVGEPITFSTVPKDKVPDAELAPKRLHDILKGLHTNANKVVQFTDVDFQTTAGPVTVQTVADGTVA